MSGSQDRESSLSAELIAEAASWCARNDHDSTSVENGLGFRGWLADDPRRRAAFDAVSRTLTDPALITALREVDQVSSRPIAARKFVGSIPFRTWGAAGLLLICVAWLTWPIAGRFRLNNPEALLRRLSALHGFAVTRMDAALMIGPRASET